MTKQQGTISYAGLDQQFIGGKWRTGRSEHKLLNHNPFTGGVIFEMAQANRLDLEDAYTVAASSFRGWAGTMPETRSSIFRRVASIMEHRREEIISWLIQESGSTRLKASLEYETTRAIMLSSAATPYEVAGRILKTDVPNKEGRVYRKPVGVVGVISPWNWPLHLSARSVAPALSVGNAVVLKPASDTPVTGGLLLAKLFEEAGLPAGVFNVIVGSGSEIGDSFVTHPVPRVISFTGSTPVGRRVGELAAKAPIIKRTELELGGNSPFVVLDDADLNHVMDAAIFGKFLHQGQICMAVNRFIVDDSLYEDFVEFFVEKAEALNVGDPAKPDTMIGPIINESQLNKLKERAEDARNSGAKELLSGEPRGLVFPPHVYADVNNGSRLAQEEIFGPIAPIIRAQGEADALRIANDTQFGLSGCVFTSNFERGQRFAERMQTGMAHVNDQPVLDIPNNPFGGEKNSGIGRFNGVWAIEAFTTDQWVSIQHAPHPYPMDSREVQGPWAGGG